MWLLGLLLACGPDLPDPPAPVPQDSLYTLDVELVNQTGADTSLAVWRGHPTLVSMIYASCPMACPILMNDLKALEAQLSPETRAQTRVLLITLDPEQDGPKELADVAKTYEVDTQRWQFVRGSPMDTRTMAQHLDVTFALRADGEMDHTSLIALLNPEGQVIDSLFGLQQDNTHFIARLDGLVEQVKR